MAKPQVIYDEKGLEVAYAHDASPESVQRVLGARANDDDGRSGWTWFRLRNGDLILGVFPRGATYESVEGDAEFPWDETIPERPYPIPDGWRVIAFRKPKIGEKYFSEVRRARPYQCNREGAATLGTTEGKKWIVVPETSEPSSS